MIIPTKSKNIPTKYMSLKKCQLITFASHFPVSKRPFKSTKFLNGAVFNRESEKTHSLSVTLVLNELMEP